MNAKTAKTALALTIILLAAIPLNAGGNKKKDPERAMLEKMEAVPCGAKEKGVTGLGTVWASAGITHVNSDEKLCPQYEVVTDDMEYHIRPTPNIPSSCRWVKKSSSRSRRTACT
jgi:hypothetical protein